MPIKDKFADASKEATGEIDVLPITDIQAEFPNLASNNGEKKNLSMSEYGSAIGTSPGQQVKFSDMFGVSNYTKITFKPGHRKQSYNVNYGRGYGGQNLTGTQQSDQVGIGQGENFLASVQGRYTSTFTGPGDKTINAVITDNSNINARIPGYNRCDVLCFESKDNGDFHESSSGLAPLYNSHRPDIRLFIKSYDEIPIFGADANNSGFAEYDPHWNWIKLTGKFYTRTSPTTSRNFSTTLDTFEKSFYFWRHSSELKNLTSANGGSNSFLKYTGRDQVDFGQQVQWDEIGINSFNNNNFYSALPGYWDTPLTIHDAAQPLREAVTALQFDAWGSGGATKNNDGQYFFNPGTDHSQFGGSGIHVYCWHGQYDGPGNQPFQVIPQYRPMFGNASNRVFGYHKMSTVETDPTNKYTLEFLVKHDNSYYDSFGIDYGEESSGGAGDVWANIG